MGGKDRGEKRILREVENGGSEKRPKDSRVELSEPPNKLAQLFGRNFLNAHLRARMGEMSYKFLSFDGPQKTGRGAAQKASPPLLCPLCAGSRM